ncbi:MAG: universal stress protein [Anaerolineales bacterium]
MPAPNAVYSIFRSMQSWGVSAVTRISRVPSCRAEDRECWAGVKAAFLEEGAGMPPKGFTSIEARVMEVKTDGPPTPDIQPDNLIIKAEYAEFLETTGSKSTLEEREVDLVLMGSQGGSILRQVFVGSALDYMLRESKTPIFICR